MKKTIHLIMILTSIIVLIKVPITFGVDRLVDIPVPPNSSGYTDFSPEEGEERERQIQEQQQQQNNANTSDDSSSLAETEIKNNSSENIEDKEKTNNTLIEEVNEIKYNNKVNWNKKGIYIAIIIFVFLILVIAIFFPKRKRHSKH